MMSRWTEDKKRFSKHGLDRWIAIPNIYRVTTDQGVFEYRTVNRLDYKVTVQNFRKAGYTNINICYIGRDVTGWKRD